MPTVVPASVPAEHTGPEISRSCADDLLHYHREETDRMLSHAARRERRPDEIGPPIGTQRGHCQIIEARLELDDPIARDRAHAILFARQDLEEQRIVERRRQQDARERGMVRGGRRRLWIERVAQRGFSNWTHANA